MKRLISALQFAVSGISHAFLNEINFRIEACCGIVALTLAFNLKTTASETALIILNIGAVLSAELFNTSAERLCDLACPEVHPSAKLVKDISAGAVLVTVFAALVCGLVIFMPHIFQFIKTL